MFNKQIITFYILAMCTFSGFSQDQKLELANQKYNAMAYVGAAKLYEKIIKKGYEQEDIFQKLGNAYYFNANYEKAFKSYQHLFELNESQDEVYLFRYMQVLKAMGQFDQAEEIAKRYNPKKSDSTSTVLKKPFGYLYDNKKKIGKVTVTDAGINSEFADYGAFVLKNQFIFTSEREITGPTKDMFLWTENPFSNVFNAERDSEGNLTNVSPFLKKMNSKFNESTAVFSKDGKTMYFTRTSFSELTEDLEKDTVMRLKIFKATLQDGEWTNFIELPINNDAYNCAHPALNQEGDILYFVSDMPGSKGKSDLYSIKLFGNDIYGVPVNLGDAINTENRETFPFISESNELFFASDGHTGYGGLDVFVTIPMDNNTFTDIYNMGAPVNGNRDDFAFFLNNDRKTGFLTSNRDGGQGKDDIYTIKLDSVLPIVKPTAKPLITLKGTVRDAKNDQLLPNVEVLVLYTDENELITKTITDDKGHFNLFVKPDQAIELEFTRKTHQTKKILMNLPDSATEKEVFLAPKENMKELADLNTIYFDFNTTYIRPDAAKELDKIVTLMLKSYPTMVIKIESHTDPVGAASYNEKLSNGRAAATYRYLISEGVPASRIQSYQGYGEQRPVNSCTNLKDCSAEQLELNRRTEFPIITF